MVPERFISASAKGGLVIDARTGSIRGTANVSRPSAGRPTREQARQRQEELLEGALDIFLEYGFESATMEQIATSIGMSKRTIYAYYADKEALFRAAVERAIERYRIPREAFEAVGSDDLEATLRAVGHLRVTTVSHPVSLKLQRALAAQAHRFPDLFTAAFERGVSPTIGFLVDLFARHEARGEIRVSDPERAAVAFITLVVGGSARIIIAGAPLSEDEIEARITYGVDLFLNGIRAR
jgi:TetR/AcrR family transcriptional regulator, mexJK operon transcriptional repressor